MALSIGFSDVPKSLAVNVQYLRFGLRNIALLDCNPRRTVSVSVRRCCCSLCCFCRYFGAVTVVLLKWGGSDYVSIGRNRPRSVKERLNEKLNKEPISRNLNLIVLIA